MHEKDLSTRENAEPISKKVVPVYVYPGCSIDAEKIFVKLRHLD